jgi:transposase-like protein
MGRARRRRRRSREEIDALLEHFDRSGLTQIGFARRQGLSVSTLRFWLDRRRRGGESHFVPVAITEGAVAGRPGLELELGGERRIHIPVDIEPEALRALLPILVAAC